MSAIVSPRPRHDPRRPALRALGPGERSQPPFGRGDTGVSRRPALRVLPGADREAAPQLEPVLLAGADEHARERMRIEFRATLAPDTAWVEANDVASVLERAAHSRMAILAGDLEDSDSESLMRLLGRRHPELPVIRVEAPLPPVAAGGRG